MAIREARDDEQAALSTGAGETLREHLPGLWMAALLHGERSDIVLFSCR